MKQDSYSSELYRPFLLILLAVTLYFAYQVIKPFIHTIILSFLIGTVILPLNEKMLKLTRGRKNLSAFIVVTLVVFIILIPFVIFLSALVSQAVYTVNQINDWLKSGRVYEFLQNSNVEEMFLRINKYIEELGFPEINIKEIDFTSPLLSVTRYIGQFIVSHGKSFLSNVVQMFFHFLVMIFLMFYVVRDNQRIVQKIKKLSPLREEQEERILSLIRSVAKSAIIGNLGTAIAQGIAGAIGLAIVGIPALFWGTMIAISSLIPIVGTAVIWIPTTIYLLIIGKVKSAIFFALWSTLIVGSVDNVLRPVLMKGGGELSTFFLFLAIMGGVQCFGLLGIIYGPIILGCAIVLVYIYEIEYAK